MQTYVPSVHTGYITVVMFFRGAPKTTYLDSVSSRRHGSCERSQKPMLFTIPVGLLIVKIQVVGWNHRLAHPLCHCGQSKSAWGKLVSTALSEQHKIHSNIASILSDIQSEVYKLSMGVQFYEDNERRTCQPEHIQF